MKCTDDTNEHLCAGTYICDTDRLAVHCKNNFRKCGAQKRKKAAHFYYQSKRISKNGIDLQLPLILERNQHSYRDG